MCEEDVKVLNKLIDTTKYFLSGAGRTIIVLSRQDKYYICTLDYLDDKVEAGYVISNIDNVMSMRKTNVLYSDPEYSEKINNFIDAAVKERKATGCHWG